MRTAAPLVMVVRERRDRALFEGRRSGEGRAVARDLGLDEVVDHFTLVGDEMGQLRNKAGATRLGFALALKFLLWRGRFPRGGHELAADAVPALPRGEADRLLRVSAHFGSNQDPAILLGVAERRQRHVTNRAGGTRYAGQPWGTIGLVTYLVAGFLMLSMGGAILAAPVTIPLMWIAASRHPTRAFRVAATVLSALTVAEVVWALTYLAVAEVQPWIWLWPSLSALVVVAIVARALGRSAWRSLPGQ